MMSWFTNQKPINMLITKTLQMKWQTISVSIKDNQDTKLKEDGLHFKLKLTMITLNLIIIELLGDILEI